MSWLRHGRSASAGRRLPAYSLVLGLIALFGYMARAVPAVNAGVKAGHGNAQLSVPLLFAHMFPHHDHRSHHQRGCLGRAHPPLPQDRLQDGYDETRPADYVADPCRFQPPRPGARIPGYVTTR
ncbi:MAG: hypothetical protein ACRDOH_34100 [Streptosporangiaceae bacterium]